MPYPLAPKVSARGAAAPRGPSRAFRLLLSLLLVPVLPACESAVTGPATDAPAALVLDTPELALAPGETARIHATVVGAAGLPITSPSAGTAKGSANAIAWTSSDPATLDVDQAGVVLAKDEGTATVTASFGALTSVARVTVSAEATGTATPQGNVPRAILVTAVQVAGGPAYPAVHAGMANGARIYTDREYTFQSVLGLLAGHTYLRTRSGDQDVTGVADFLSFTIDRAATVIVAYHAASPPPAWLTQNFLATGEHVIVRRNQQQLRFDLYARNYAAGRVTLGSNRDVPGSAAMYGVIVRPFAGPLAPAGPDFRQVVEGIRPRGFGQGSYTLVQPAPGRTMYWVAPTGNDGHPGTSAQPFRTIDRAAQVAGAGDVVTIRNGTYNESVRVRNGGTPDRRIVFQAQNRGGVVLTGGQHTFAPHGWNGSVRQTGAVFVTVRGLIFREYSRAASVVSPPDRPAVAAIRGWRIEDCLFDRAGHDGVMIRGDDVSIVRSTFQFTHTHAIIAGTGESPHSWGGGQLRRIQVVDVTLRGNNTRPDPLMAPASTKVVKFMMTDDVLVDNIESFDNRGPGWWFDRYNSNYVIRNSYFHGNRNDAPNTTNGRGVYLEVNHGPGLVENNVMVNNVREAVNVANSERVRIVGNLMVGNDRCVILSATDRGGPDRLRDVLVQDNFCKSWNGASAVHPQGPLITTPAALQIRLDGNTYDPGPVDRLTWWPNVGSLTTIPQMRQQLGWEQNGRIAPIQWPVN